MLSAILAQTGETLTVAGLLTVGIAAVWKDGRQREARHREDWRQANDEREHHSSKLETIIENNTRVMQQYVNESREVKHAIRNAPCGKNLRPEPPEEARTESNGSVT